MLPHPTARLAFREMTHDDFGDMYALLGNPQVMAFYPHPKSNDEVRGWIDSSLRSYEANGFGLRILELAHSGTFIGDCGLTYQEVDGETVLEVGYQLLPEYQGKGYATEAANACLNLAFGTIGADRLTAIINPRNAPSRAVAERLGMTAEVETVTKSGLPVVVYGIRRSPTTLAE
jgi:RimJ/RimL family protein N-acetyltransferase